MSLCQDCLHGFIKERESQNVREHYGYYGSGTAAHSNGKFLQCLSNTHAGYGTPSQMYNYSIYISFLFYIYIFLIYICLSVLFYEKLNNDCLMPVNGLDAVLKISEDFTLPSRGILGTTVTTANMLSKVWLKERFNFS